MQSSDLSSAIAMKKSQNIFADCNLQQDANNQTAVRFEIKVQLQSTV